MLRSNRHKHAKRKRIASVRLDLEDSSGFTENSLTRRQIIWKVFTVILLCLALTAILYDYGFAKFGKKVSDFVSGIGQGAKRVALENSTADNETTIAALDEISRLRDTAATIDTDTHSVFYPEGSKEAISCVKLALETSKVGLLTQAMELLDQAKAIDPEITGLDYIRASAYLDAGNLEKASEFYRLAIQQQETYFLSHLALGRLEYQQQNYPDAITHLTIVRKLKPRDVQIAKLLSNALRFNRQHQEGLFEALAVQRLEPDIKAYQIMASLAAIQARTFELPTEILAIINAAEIDTSASPFDLVIAAGWEHWQGNTDRVEQYWDVIRPHASRMTSLNELEKDPLFTLTLTTEPPPVMRTGQPVNSPLSITTGIQQEAMENTLVFQEKKPELKFRADISTGTDQKPESGFYQPDPETPVKP
ncbi:MAG: hypothetical protein AAF649_05940 [Verrucomicrobiota bacterium]